MANVLVYHTRLFPLSCNTFCGLITKVHNDKVKRSISKEKLAIKPQVQIFTSELLTC